MAERLTGKSQRGFYLKDDFGGRIRCNNDREIINAYYGKPLITKLGKLEEILEKYGIESVKELECFLDDYSKNQGRYFAICEERDDLKKDRDTWKRACELACEGAPFYCPEPPERYNAQDEYGSDEPYYIYEGGCEFNDSDYCVECKMNYYYEQAKEKERDNE